MAIRAVVSRGFGNGTFDGTIALIATRGYLPGVAAVGWWPIELEKKRRQRRLYAEAGYRRQVVEPTLDRIIAELLPPEPVAEPAEFTAPTVEEPWLPAESYAAPPSQEPIVTFSPLLPVTVGLLAIAERLKWQRALDAMREREDEEAILLWLLADD